MPIRSGAMQRPRGCRCGNTLRQRYDEVGLPCSSTMGSPSPTSTYAISLPRTRRRCFWCGNAVEIMLASPSYFVVAEYHRRPPSFVVAEHQVVAEYHRRPRAHNYRVAREAYQRATPGDTLLTVVRARVRSL